MHPLVAADGVIAKVTDVWYIRVMQELRGRLQAQDNEMKTSMKRSAVTDAEKEESAVAQTMAEALRETDLTAEEAEELRERLEKPRVLPARQSRDLPTMDPSRLHS